MTKSNFDIIKKQREDIMAAYREVAPSCWSQQEAWEKTARHPAPRYYISPKQAWDVMRRMVVGDFALVDKMSKQYKARYYSLFEKLQQISQKREYLGMSLWQLCHHLVHQPAPEFFVKPETVKQIFLYYKKHGSDYKYTEIHPEYFVKKSKD